MEELEKKIQKLSTDIAGVSDKLDSYTIQQQQHYEDAIKTEKQRGNAKAWSASFITLFVFFLLVILYGTFT